MRHVAVLVSLLVTMLVTGLALDGLARRSPAPGLILAWNSNPGKMLSSLPSGQVRVVNTWLSGHMVQLHVESMRDFETPLAATRLAIRLPEVTVTMAGCG
jgi:hypothetical protein